MPTHGGIGGLRQIPSGDFDKFWLVLSRRLINSSQLNRKYMITQNPIIGKARKKLGAIYARTLYGKNVLQSCPPPTKGKEAPTQLAAQKAFGIVSRLSAQFPASLLNNLYYSPPSGRSRRQQWCKDLAKGSVKVNGVWSYQPSLIQRLGGNPKVSQAAISLTVTSKRVEIPISSLSTVNNAIVNEPPCIILIDVADLICISLLDYTTIENETIVLQNLSSTLIGKECWLFPLWLTNVGTQQSPIYQYGSYQKNL